MTNAVLNAPETGRPDASPDESAHDILRVGQNSLDSIFSPKVIAVIGATERKHSVGRTIMANLSQGGFPGKIYPVNPIQDSVLGLRAYPNVSALPEKPDLAIIITPAAVVPGIVKECAAVGVRGAIIISAGFKEIGEAGAALEEQILAEARREQVRIIMRHAGPRMLWEHPIMSLRHWFDGFR